jgi:hypothetical protein
MAQVTGSTEGTKCLCMNVVEGKAVRVTTSEGSMVFNYAESFILAAAVGKYTLEALGTIFVITGGPCKVLEVFLKLDKLSE